jgi:hypothetical protein
VKTETTTTTEAGECAHCGGSMESKRPQATYCGERCRDRARRQRDREAARTAYIRKGYPATVPARWRHKPGDRFGSLVILERLGKLDGTSFVLCRCDCGNEKQGRLQNLVSGAAVDCADREHHADPRSKGDSIGYGAAHQRVAKLKGSAREHQCYRCGQRAEHWAYSHGDPDEKRNGHGKAKGMPYSTDPEHYLAMCRSCHSRADKAHSRVAGDTLSLPHVVLWASFSGHWRSGR